MIKKRHFTIVELLVVITIIAILAGLTLSFLLKSQEPGFRVATKATILNIERALDSYKVSNGHYPLESIAGAINLSDASNSEVKSAIVELLKLESFSVNDQGVPEDDWENPIYLIYAKNYGVSPLAASIPSLSEQVFYNPNSFQIVSGGSDGTKTSLGAAEDNVANYPKK
jgi:type II secretory pathway pseudopilin PulG